MIFEVRGLVVDAEVIVFVVKEDVVVVVEEIEIEVDAEKVVVDVIVLVELVNMEVVVLIVEVEVDEFHPYTFLVNSLQYQWCRHSQSPHSCMSSTATPYGWLFAFLPTHFTSSLCTNASRSNGRGSAERTMSYPIPGGRVTVWFPEMRIRTVFKDRTILDLFPGEKVRSLIQPLILRSVWPCCSGTQLISP